MEANTNIILDANFITELRNKALEAEALKAIEIVKAEADRLVKRFADAIKNDPETIKIEIDKPKNILIEELEARGFRIVCQFGGWYVSL